MKLIRKKIPLVFLVVSLLAVYGSSLAPGLTWANFGADGGDLITAAATGGIAHPTGYPLYLLLARLFQWIPLGSLAFRTNLMSALATVGAAALVYGLVTRSFLFDSKNDPWLAGLVAGFAYGLAPLVWSQAVITEVYGLHSFFVALLITIAISEVSGKFTQKHKDILLGLAFGLAMGNHMTTILLFPVLLTGLASGDPTPAQGNWWKAHWNKEGRSLLRRFAFLGVGLLVYLILPLRAIAKPPVNWGNPVNLAGFTWLVSGKLYQGQLFALSFASVWERFRVVVAMFLEQFGIPGLTVGLIGLIVFFKTSRLYLNLFWILVASTIFAILYATTDAFMYLIPAVLCFSIWIGIGVGKIINTASRWSRQIGVTIGIVLILTLFLQAWKHWPQVDAADDHRAEHFIENVNDLAPESAIIFAKGDQAVFSLWYSQFALLNRPDLVILAADLLQFDWYQATLHDTYPDLNVPGPFPFTETVVLANPERAVCYAQYTQNAEINCTPARGFTQP